VDESGSTQGSQLCRTLGVKAGHRVLVLEPPLGYLRKLQPLPEGAALNLKAQGQADLIVLFAPSRAVLTELFHKAVRVMAPRGRVWALWPRRSSGFFTDLSEEAVRMVGLSHALTDDKELAVDEIWTGLRFVFKERDRLLVPRSQELRPSDA
jgi:hypothetical protein